MAIKRPRLKLTKGQTYTFDVSDPALATHPFKFTADSGTSEYTTGVTLTGTQGQAGAVISLTVSDSAPTNLNYYCGDHGLSKGNHVVIIAAPAGGGGGGGGSGSVTYSVSQIDSEGDYEQIKSLGYESQMPTAFNVTFSGDGNYMYTSGNSLLIQYGPLNTPYDITTSMSSTTAITWGVNGSGWDHMSNAGMIEPYKDTISSYKNYSNGHGFYSPYQVYEPFINNTDAMQNIPRYHSQTTPGAFSTQSTNNSQTIAFHYDDLNNVLDSDVDARHIKEHIRWLGTEGAYMALFSKSYGSSYGAQLAVWSQPGDAYSADGFYSYGETATNNKYVAPGWAAYYVGGKDLKGLVNNYHGITESSFSDYEMNDAGTKVWLLSRGTKWLYELTLTTPFNPKTATYDGTRFAVTMFNTPTSLHWNESRRSLFIGGDGLKVNGSYGTGNAVIEYKLAEGWSGGVVLSELPANSGGRSTSYADDGQIATNGTYTVVGDPRMNIGTINQPGWAWIYRNSDGKEMASFNSILDGHAPNDSQLYSRNGNSGQYASSKYHKMYFGQRVAINDTYAFITAPIAYSAGESNWGNGQDGSGEFGGPVNAYVSVIKLSDMTHVRTIKMDGNLYSTGPSYAGGATNWGATGIAATNDWLAIGATHADVGTGQASGAGAIEVFNISDANPANWTSSILENVYKNSGNGNLFNFGFGIAIEGNKLASNHRSVLQAWSWNGTSWVSGSSSQSAFPNGNSDPDNLFIKNDKIYYSRTTGSPSYNAFIEARSHSGLSILFSKQINEGNAYPGYSLMYDDSDHIFTADAGYNDGNANAGRIMAYTLDSANHVANFDTQSLQGQGSTNNYYGSTFDVSKGWLISKETNQNPNPDVEYLTFRDYRTAVAPASSTGVWYGNRAIFAGGNATGANPSNRIEYVDISAFNSNTTDFGDLQSARKGITGTSNGTIGVFIGGDEDNPIVDTIDKITTTTTGNATDFGNTTAAMRAMGSSCDGSRALYGGGSYASVMKSNVIEYITIATPGNGIDFGNLTETIELSSFVNDATYSVRAGGQNDLNPNTTDAMDYVTMQTTSNATSFGTLSRSTWFGRNSVSSTTRGLFAGGSQRVNNIDYITIATPGNSSDFGDLTVSVTGTSAASNNTRGLFAGGIAAGGNTNDMSYVTIATTGNATGGYTLADGVYNHGGLSGNDA